MRLTAADKQKITETIRAGAARAFRAQGYEAVTLDVLMKQSGLTRGAFYAHYPSKQAVLRDVVRHEHPLLHMLERRDGKTPEALREQLSAIFHGYLAPENREEVLHGCSLAALTGDVIRSHDDIKAAHGEVFSLILTEMARGLPCQDTAMAPALILAVGAVQTASAMTDPTQQAVILKAAGTQVQAYIHAVTEP